MSEFLPRIGPDKVLIAEETDPQALLKRVANLLARAARPRRKMSDAIKTEIIAEVVVPGLALHGDITKSGIQNGYTFQAGYLEELLEDKLKK